MNSCQTVLAGSPPAGGAASVPGSRFAIVAAGAVIALAALAAYHRTFSVPFLFDDSGSIPQNPTIRHLWPMGEALSPPAGGLTVSGRPVLNLTLAINYALGGSKVWSYHAVNLAIHLLAGLTLFGVVRWTFLGKGSKEQGEGKTGAVLRAPFSVRLHDGATVLASVVALIWTLHPLQTEAVTYIVQRAESLVSLFYLLTLYCFIRGGECQERVGSPSTGSGHSPPDSMACHERRPKAGVEWFALSAAACLLGMATKEVMVSAPLIVLLYDRTFLANSFSAAWRQRWRFHLALFCTWLLLGWLMIGTAGRGGTAGQTTEITWWAYALTQCRAVVRYLCLSVWPSPLVFDYGTGVTGRVTDVLGQAVILLLLLAGTLVALRRWPAVGFTGAAFFAILAPSSSVVPVVTQTMAEHRMYLALAPVVVLLVLGMYAVLGRRSVIAGLFLTAGLGWLTVQRNEDYRSELTLWQDTAEKCPENARAQSSLGSVLLFNLGQIPEAMARLEKALRLQPGNADALNNLGTALFRLGRTGEAIARYEQALQFRPGYAEAHVNLGMVLTNTGRLSEAIAQFEEGIRLKPDNADAHFKLALALWQAGRTQEAGAQHDEGLRLRAAGF